MQFWPLWVNLRRNWLSKPAKFLGAKGANELIILWLLKLTYTKTWGSNSLGQSTNIFVAPLETKHNTHSNPVSMAALVTLFPAAFVITELLASKLSTKVGIHRYNTANRDTQTSQPNLIFLQSTSRLQTCGPRVTWGFLNLAANKLLCLLSALVDSSPEKPSL